MEAGLRIGSRWMAADGRVAATLVCTLAIALSGCGETSRPAETSASTISTPVTTTAPQPGRIRLVVDTDLAVDSVMALLYLLGRPEVDVAAITVSGTGEVSCGPGAEIAAGLVALAGRDGIPVACGRGEPLEGSNAFPADWRSAADAAWGLDLPAGEAPSELSAPDLLVSVVSSSAEPLVVFAEGPLTNLAAALRLDGRIAGRIAMIYIMGGAIDAPGNTPVNPDAEYNIWVDPTAAAEVFASGVPITLVPLDATNQVPLEARHIRALEKHATAPAAAAVLRMLQPREDMGLFFWDQLTAAILVDESVAGFETMALEVTTDGGPNRVGTTRRGLGGNEIRVAVTVDAERFEREFLSSLAGEDVGPVAMVPRQPVGTVEDLLAPLLVAAGAGDVNAVAALCTDEALQSAYVVTEGVGSLLESSSLAAWSRESDLLGVMEVIGEPLVVGDAMAISVRSSVAEEQAPVGEGFAVVVGDRSADGVLVAGVVSFLSLEDPPADAAVVQQLIEAQATAWNADDVDGVFSTMSDEIMLWGDVLYPETIDSGPALREMIAGAFVMREEVSGLAVISGPFAAVPLRFTDETSGGRLDVIAILWIRDGRIALMAIAQGELQG